MTDYLMDDWVRDVERAKKREKVNFRKRLVLEYDSRGKSKRDKLIFKSIVSCPIGKTFSFDDSRLLCKECIFNHYCSKIHSIYDSSRERLIIEDYISD